MTLFYKTQQILLQNVTAILLQNATESYYKMQQKVITKCFRSSSINDFKHKIKEFYFEELKKTKRES